MVHPRFMVTEDGDDIIFLISNSGWKAVSIEKGEAMVKRVWVLIFSLVCINAAAASEMTGREIMQKQKDLHQSKTEFIEQNMILVDRSGGKEARKLRHYLSESEPDVDRALIVFLSPADIRGTALLTWQHKDRDDDQWLYLPAQGKMQRIVKGGKRNSFMGTDFTYEDLENEVLDDFTYTRTGDEEVDESPCYVV